MVKVGDTMTLGGGSDCALGNSWMINREVEKKPVARSAIGDASQLLTSSLIICLPAPAECIHQVTSECFLLQYIIHTMQYTM